MKCGDHHPRTLIISWHWPPTGRASASVLGALFRFAPPGIFRVITRSFDKPGASQGQQAHDDLNARIPPVNVRWPYDDQGQPGLRAWPTLVGTVWAMVRHGGRVDREWDVQRVLAVYPHRFSMLIGWWIARKLNVPLVLYMHDLCAEALAFGNPLRRWFWRNVDRRCLREAWLVLVPTQEFAAHYERRGINRCWVLPHCAAHDVQQAEPPKLSRVLRLLYSGRVYEPHADAMRAFVSATRGLSGVSVTYLTDPTDCGGLMDEVGGRWLPREQAMAVLPSADVFVLLLGSNTPWPEEVMGCFPSKILDYLCVGRPILALAPKGSFVDRLVSQSGCGMVVHDHSPASIRSVIEGFRDPHRRSEMAAAGRRLAGQLRGDVWMERLTERLHLGPAARSSQPGFPESTGRRNSQDDDGKPAAEKSATGSWTSDTGAEIEFAGSSLPLVSSDTAFSLG